MPNPYIYGFTPYLAKSIYLNSQPLVVSSYRDPQPQVVENYFATKHLQSMMFMKSFHSQ